MASPSTTKRPFWSLPDQSVFLPMLVFLIIGVGMAYVDRRLLLNTLLLECVHALVATAIFVACLVYERRYPHIRQFGWSNIVWGLFLLMLGTWVDIIDDPPIFGGYGGFRFPFGPSWERAFLKKTLGYTAGISFFAYGFFQWIPWMIQTRLKMQKLNESLSETNRQLNQTLMSLDEHVESERAAIARELHDDVAQQLTYVNIQAQLCRKDLDAGHPDEARQKLTELGRNVSEALKSVRQISTNLRPESLFSLGLIPALEQFIEKTQPQYPDTAILLTVNSLEDGGSHLRFEESASDGELLNLYRIIQEGIRNALKHADAGLIRIGIDETANPYGLQIRIEDTGKGLPWLEVPADDVLIQQGHLGIVGLKERVRELGGVFHMSRQPDGPGTRLEIILES